MVLDIGIRSDISKTATDGELGKRFWTVKSITAEAIHRSLNGKGHVLTRNNKIMFKVLYIYIFSIQLTAIIHCCSNCLSLKFNAAFFHFIFILFSFHITIRKSFNRD